MTPDLDAAVRLRAFDFLTEQRRRFGEASIPRAVLERGFDFEGVRVPLIGPQGIFKPAILPELPLTITTAPPVEHRERPYDDGFIDAGFLRYRYRGTDPSHRDNVGLRTAMQRQTPLIADVGRAGVQISERLDEAGCEILVEEQLGGLLRQPGYSRSGARARQRTPGMRGCPRG